MTATTTLITELKDSTTELTLPNDLMVIPLRVDISALLMEQITHFQQAMHLHHRASAVRYLLQLGLQTEMNRLKFSR